MNEAHADSSAPGLAGPNPQPEGRGEGLPAAPTQAAPEAPPRREPPSGGWSTQRWLTLVALVFAAQVALIFALGEKKFPLPRAVTNVPQIMLADDTNELIALDDPTLFVLPHANDFASVAWRQAPVAPQPSFRWTEPPGELQAPAREDLGAVFTRFMQTNPFAAPPLDFKPEPELSKPVLSLPLAFAENSTLQISGELAQRRLLNENEIHLPSLPFNDVLAPSKVQALVDAEGNVVSAILLPSENAIETLGRADKGDTNALAIARSLRFAPSSRPMFGELIFNWRTVPLAETNAP
jgi:hypothetical protein